MADFLQNRFVTLWQFIEVFKLLRWGNTLFVKLLKEKGLSLIFCTTKIIQIFLFYCVFLPDFVSKNFAVWSGAILILRMVLFLYRELSREYISTANRKLLLALQKVKVLFALFLFPTLCLQFWKHKEKVMIFTSSPELANLPNLELCRIASRQFWKSVVSETLIFIFSAILMLLYALKTASIQRLSASCSVMRTQALPSTDMFILPCRWKRIMWAD